MANSELHWYNNAIIYAVDVGAFYDGNGDGVGDFKGLTEKLDHFTYLGVNCIWLLPFYESKERDNGYDIDDYYGINPKFGDFDDFLIFKKEAEKRNLRIIIDLVVHHTSDNHHWFKLAAHNKESKYYNYYKWNATPPVIAEESSFKGQESNTWEYCEMNDEYYFHKYYSFEPDLNILNPDVQNEIKEIIRFWLGFGVSGFRLDAATHLFSEFEDEKTAGKVMEDLRDFMVSIKKDAFFLAEADLPAKEIKQFIGKGNRMGLIFNFLLNNSTFLALARKNAEPIINRLKEQQKMPANVRWANFIRNHDELDLDQLSDDEREEVFHTFAPREIMKAFGRGIRRRLAPLINGNPKCNKMIMNYLIALPGVPVITYGDEIGMGDNLVYEGRNAVRTPMQWDNSHNGGFSDAPAEELELKSIEEGIFSYKFVNVAAEKKSENSLLHRISDFIKHRLNLASLFLEKPEIIDTGCSEVLGLIYRNELFIYLNFSDHSKKVCFEEDPNDFDELLQDTHYDPVDKRSKLRVHGYGYRWLRRKHKTQEKSPEKDL